MNTSKRHTTRCRLLIGDDHPLFAKGVAKVLEDTYEVIGTVGDGLALVRAAKQLNPVTASMLRAKSGSLFQKQCCCPSQRIPALATLLKKHSKRVPTLPGEACCTV
jgi:DNA-binding NarL/FixJ family response regulator